MARTTATVTTPPRRFDPLGAVWRFSTSVRVAILQIALIAVCTFIGTLVPQAAQAGLFDQVAYQNWLVFQRGKFGNFVPLMDLLGLFNIFQTVYFRGLLAVLTLSIILCTINRIPGIWRNAMVLPPLKVGDKLFEVHQTARRLDAGAVDEAAALDHLTAALRARRYRVLTEASGDHTYVYADKNRFGIFGTFVSHTGLVLVLVGALVGSIFGWRDDVFTVTDGSTRPVGFGTNLAVRNELFVDEYDPVTGQPSDFYTDAVLLEQRGDAWTEIKRHRIRVNTPLEHNGVVVHQAFFGPSAVLTVKDNQGNVMFSGGIPLPYRNPDGRPIGWVDVPAGRFPIPLTVFVVGRAPVGASGDPLIEPGQVVVEVYPAGQATENNLLYRDLLDLGTPAAMKAPTGRTILEFTFERERQFTGLNLSYNPGLPLIWSACGLMLLGWGAVFYFPHRRLRALVSRDAHGRAQIAAAVISRLDLGARNEYERLLADVQGRLQPTATAPVSAVAD